MQLSPLAPLASRQLAACAALWLLAARVASVAAGSHGAHLRASARLALDVRRGATAKTAAAVDYWDYKDNGKSWSIGECPTGLLQSPINTSLCSRAVETLPDKLFYRFPVLESPLKMTNDGHFLTAVIPNDYAGSIALGQFFPHTVTGRWDLKKIMVHTPSEHTFEGQKADLELQLVHEKRAHFESAALTAIVSVGFVKAAEAPGSYLSGFLNALHSGGLPKEPNQESTVNGDSTVHLNFDELYAPTEEQRENKALGGSFLQYTGSLTTPPCTGGATWFVRNDALKAGPETLAHFYDAVASLTGMEQGEPGNARSLHAVDPSQVVTQRYSVSKIGAKDVSSSDPFFDNAVQEALKEQKEFATSMSTDSEAKPSDASDIASQYDQDTLENNPEKIVQQDNAVEACMNELNSVQQKLLSAETRKKGNCATADSAEKEVEMSDGGVTQMVAANKAGTAVATCEGDEKTVMALITQVNATQARCDEQEKVVMEQVNVAKLQGQGYAAGGDGKADNEDAGSSATGGNSTATDDAEDST